MLKPTCVTPGTNFENLSEQNKVKLLKDSLLRNVLDLNTPLA